MTIYIGNLSFKATEEIIRKMFARFGTVKKVKIPPAIETGLINRFAFVDMSSEEEELKAIEDLDKVELMERSLHVVKAQASHLRRSLF